MVQKRPQSPSPLGDFDLDESPDAPPVSEQIVAALMANSAKVLDLFRSWDDDGDGTVTRAEFHKAMKELGLEVPAEAIDDIFSSWDKDGGGELTLRELTKILNAAATAARNMASLRKLLGKKKLKIVALFRDNDTSGDNELDRQEFGKFIKQLGLVIPPDQVTALFETFDRDRSGKITYRELDRMLALEEAKEQAELKAKEEEERRLLMDPPVVPVEIDSLRNELLTKFKGYGFEGKTAYRSGADAIAAAAELAAEQERLLAESGEARAKTIHAKRQERARRQARMRLRGTGLETQVDPGGVGPKAERRPNVTRNGRRAVLPPVEAVKKSKSTQELPSLVDQLSRHRIAKATPSRRHFNLLPHVTQSRPNPAWLQRAQRHLPPLLPPTHMFGEDPAVLRAELEAARAENARLREVIETGKMTRSISQPWYL